MDAPSQPATTEPSTARVLVLLGAAAAGALLLLFSSPAEAHEDGEHDHAAHEHAEAVCERLPAVPYLCTHGPDAPPPGVAGLRPPGRTELERRARTGSYVQMAGGGYTAAAASTGIDCIGNGRGGARVQALYVYPRGTQSKFTKVKPLIRRYAANADAFVNRSASQTNGGRRIRWVHTDAADCNLVVNAVRVSSAATFDFNRTIQDLLDKGYDRNDRKYLIWMEANALCGVGTSFPDDRSSQLNINNQLGGYSRVDRPCWGGGVEMHELWHNLGAVQRSAPHSTAYGHCWDDIDAMCYPDGPGTDVKQVCKSGFEWQLDCNHDDYFHTNPRDGSYLDRNWNTADSDWLESTVAPPTDPVVSMPRRGRRIAGLKFGMSATSRTSGTRTIASWRWTDDQDDCFFSAARTRTPTFWCYADHYPLLPVTITVTVVDSKGLSAVTQKSFQLANPDRARRVRLSMATTPGSVTDATVGDGRKVALTVRARDGATGRAIVGLPLNLTSTSLRALTPNLPSNAIRTSGTGTVTRKQVVRASTEYRADTRSFNATWRYVSKAKRLPWNPVLTADLANTSVETPFQGRISGKLTPVEPNSFLRNVALERRTSSGWRRLATKSTNDSGGYSFQIPAQEGGTTTSWRVRKVRAPFTSTSQYAYAFPASPSRALQTVLVMRDQVITVTNDASVPSYSYADVSAELKYHNDGLQPKLQYLDTDGTWQPAGDMFADFLDEGTYFGQVINPDPEADPGTYTFRVYVHSNREWLRNGAERFTVEFTAE